MALHNVTLEIFENNVGLSDAVLLHPLTEDAFIENLQTRFNHHQIYTYIGNVVVSVNPYQNVALYTSDVIQEYRSRNIYELPPHIYAIADDAYRSLRDKNLDQCIIISGESGSGKTEASKQIMQYIAEVSGKGTEIDRVKEQLLQSNPVLEAFGNAKTNRNDNSSRFGKYMDIEFDFKGDPIGGVITNYLLEKSRVTVQAHGERNFHIFYQLLAGADTTLLNSLRLSSNQLDYELLKHSGCLEIDSVDEKEHFDLTQQGMEIIGFKAEEIYAVYQLVASVLKLGNVQFKHRSNIDGTDGCSVSEGYDFSDVIDLLKCDVHVLISALTQKTVETRGEKVKVDLSVADAAYARDALCKAIYSHLFSWLVSRINENIKVKHRGRRKAMGVLDIYGFEVFERNGFEQFIINYCNEKLQQIFIELTLKQEQEEYVKEGIEWIHVDYFNNAVICDLIEKPNIGIIAMLDEECLRPGKVTDQTFLNKLNQTCSTNEHYESRGCRKTQSDRTLPHEAFRLKHYAGNVTYEVTGFLDKNNNLLFRDLSQAMFSCDHLLTKELFPEGDPFKTSRKRPATLATQFKVSVSELMKNLLSKNPNYIRCIKPNDYKKANVFDVNIVRHQVRYLGLMENIRVRRAGYAFRQPYEQFLYRYKMLAKETWPHWNGEMQKGVFFILKGQTVADDEVAYGRSKIFIKNPRTLFDLEERRREEMNTLATIIQRIYKGWMQRVLYQKMRQSQIVIAAKFRAFAAKKQYQKTRNAAILIAAYVRGWQARVLLAKLKQEKREQLASIVIQSYYRGFAVRKEYRKKFRANAAPKIIRFMRLTLKKRLLLRLKANLPPMSPTSREWPVLSPLFKETSMELQKIFHQWRCRKFRERFNEKEQYQMKEKVAASDIFKDKKATYPTSITHPFKGDYVSVRQNLKWKKIADQMQDKHVVFADILAKVNRANGKMVHHLFVMTTQAILVLDRRTMVTKYRIMVKQIRKISLSPYLDNIVIFHVNKPENGDSQSRKGDFIFCSDHVIEIVAKMYLLVKNQTGKTPEVNVADQVQAQFKGVITAVNFRPANDLMLPIGAVKINRKGTNYQINVQSANT